MRTKGGLSRASEHDGFVGEEAIEDVAREVGTHGWL